MRRSARARQPSKRYFSDEYVGITDERDLLSSPKNIGVLVHESW